MNPTEKQLVHDFWNAASCGESLYLSTADQNGYAAQAEERYRLEPYILPFANFGEARGKKVLEIGVGLGADHEQFAKAGAELYGIDLTPRAIEHTRSRIRLIGGQSKLSVGDAENLNFPDESFDWVYSWGVLHHSPDTPKAISEVYRVLKPGGLAKIMIYHKWSLIGLMLWLRYALLVGRPWRSLKEIYGAHLESPGTKAYSHAEAESLCQKFSEIKLSSPLGHGDLLESNAGQRHRGVALALARKIWPRWLLRRLLPDAGLTLMIEARKGAT
jgi:SAM-dependent methyltransferase